MVLRDHLSIRIDIIANILFEVNLESLAAKDVSEDDVPDLGRKLQQRRISIAFDTTYFVSLLNG